MLITGSSGLIGSKLVEKFKSEYEIIEIDREKGRSVEFQNLVNFSEKIDVIIHLASNCMIREIIKNPMLAFDNVWNVFNIFELARKSGCKKLVFFSSSRVSGGTDNPYIAGKIYGEELAKAYKECYGINYLIIRPETVWDVNEKKDRVIPLWIRQAQNNEDIIIYGNKNKEMPPIHVNDFVEVFIPIFTEFICEQLTNDYVAISGIPSKVIDIIECIKKLTNSKSKIVYKDKELGQPQKYIEDENQRIGTISFSEALERELK